MSKYVQILPGLLRKFNVRMVLDVIRQEGHCSRADLTRLTGVSAPTMAKLIDELDRLDLLEEIPHSPEGKGRPSKVYKLARKGSSFICFVLGPDTCSAGVCGINGEMLQPVRTIQTPDCYEDILETIIAFVEEVKEKRGDVNGIGLSVPGLFDHEKGEIIFSSNMHQMDGRRPADDLLAFGLENSVSIIQEEHALCLAEQLYGNAKGVDDVVLMDVSSGMGLGIIADGKLLYGARGFAGEIGHVTLEPEGVICGCGKRGCLETLSTDRTLLRLVAYDLGKEIDFDTLAKMVANGDIDISVYREEIVKHLAIGAAMVLNMLNPTLLVVHGRMFELDPNFFDNLLELVGRYALTPAFSSCAIMRSSTSKVLGAAAAAVNQFFEDIGPRL